MTLLLWFWWELTGYARMLWRQLVVVALAAAGVAWFAYSLTWMGCP